jgi:hypothetical protein
VRSFKEIIEGKHDDLPEQAFKYQVVSTMLLASVRASQAAQGGSAAGERPRSSQPLPKPSE